MAGRIHKGQLIAKVAESLECSKTDAATAVSAVLDNIGETLRENDRVTLTGFGTFEVRETPARKVRAIAGSNAGKIIDVPAGHRVAFVASKALKENARNGRT